MGRMGSEAHIRAALDDPQSGEAGLGSCSGYPDLVAFSRPVENFVVLLDLDHFGRLRKQSAFFQEKVAR